MNKEVLFSSMVDIDLRVEFLNILPSPRLPPVYTGDTLNIRYCIVLYCTVLYCTVLCCTVIHCNLLYCALL